MVLIGKKRLLGTSAIAAALTLAAFGLAPSASAQQLGWANVADIDNYAWIDRADAMAEAIGDAPPDFAFDFQGQEVWAWTLGDGSVQIVEERPDGPRSYYFDAGADAPFLVRRAEPRDNAPPPAGEGRGDEMSFGYQLGAIAVIYTADGAVLRREYARGYADEAMDDWERGRALRRAMRYRPVWRDVSLPLWFEFTDVWYDWNQDWDYGLRRHPEWQRWHDRPGSIDWRHRFDDERRRRTDAADRFHHWGESGFNGPPPGHFKPPPSGWTRSGDRRSRNPGETETHRPPPVTGGPARVRFPGAGGTSQPAVVGSPSPAPSPPSPPRPPRPDRGGFIDRTAPDAQGGQGQSQPRLHNRSVAPNGVTDGPPAGTGRPAFIRPERPAVLAAPPPPPPPTGQMQRPAYMQPSAPVRSFAAPPPPPAPPVLHPAPPPPPSPTPPPSPSSRQQGVVTQPE